MNDHKNRGFTYSYSAKERAELKKIREKYLPKHPTAEEPMERLRRLDAGVGRRASAVALVLGVLGCLLMGSGMSLIMTELSAILGLAGHQPILFGLLLGLVGMAGVIFAYPVYQLLLERERRRIAPEILRLTEQLMSE